MADVQASNWSETDGSNTSAAPDGMPEGMAPSGVNDWGRAVMGAVKRWYNHTIPKVTAGTTTAYTATYSVAPGAYVDGDTYLVRFNAANGAAPTININALGAIPIYRYSAGVWAAVASGDLTANMVCRLAYNSSEGSFRVTSSSATAIGAAFVAIANSFSALQTFTAGLTLTGAIPLVMTASAINEAKGTNIASATTTDIGAAIGNYVHVTGTTTITGLGTVQAGTRRKVVFDGILILTYDATALILPTAANITTAAGDSADFVSEGSGNWKCTNYQRASGLPFLVGTTLTLALGSDFALGDTAYHDVTGLSLSQGTTGTWDVSATITIVDSGSSAQFDFKLYDGTTVIDSGRTQTVSGSLYACVTLRGRIASPAANLRVAVKDTSSPSGVVAFNATGNSKDSTITAIRVA